MKEMKDPDERHCKIYILYIIDRLLHLYTHKIASIHMMELNLVTWKHIYYIFYRTFASVFG